MTCRITEFHQAPLSQETPFLAVVELYGRDQILEMLAAHLCAYFRFHRESQEDLEEGESNERELEAHTALDFFVALFAARENFRNESCASDYLSKATSKDDQEILQGFSTWVDELMNEQKPQNGLIYLTASTAEELSIRLEPWVTTKSMAEDDEYSKTPSFWPVVRIARVGMHSALLQRGCIISDLPGGSILPAYGREPFNNPHCLGLSDTNRMRTAATEQYIRECDYYFLVAPIARVQTDDAVHRRLRQAYKLKASRKALITTRIDVCITLFLGKISLIAQDMPITEKPRNLGASSQDAERFNRLSGALALVGEERNRLGKINRTQTGKQRLKTELRLTELM